MIKKNTLFAILFILITQVGKAQIMPLELASELKKTDYISFSIRPLDALFSADILAFFQKYHQQRELIFDEAGAQKILGWFGGSVYAPLTIGLGDFCLNKWEWKK